MQQRLQTQLKQQLAQVTDTRVQAFLASALDLSYLVAAENSTTELKHFNAYSQRLTPYNQDAQFRRLAHLYAIQLTGLANKYNFMELLARRWLTFTPLQDPGFAATAEYYGQINLNRAYDSLAQADYLLAMNSFYALTRQNSDPEALYQLLYIGLQLQPQLQQRMQLLLNQLQDEALINPQDIFAATVIELTQQPNLSVPRLQELARQLQDYQPKGVDQGAVNLLNGSIYQRLLLATQQGYKHNSAYYQQAHYHYMLGLDLAWNNPRLQAALLHNLANLHLSVRNTGLASEFFSQRLTLPFVNPEEAVLIRWQLALSLLYSNRPQEAAQQALAAQELVLQQQLNSPAVNPWIALEKAGFFAVQAEEFVQAAQLYQQLLQAPNLSQLNLAKFNFSWAYTQFKLGQQHQATIGFERVLELLPGLTAAPFQLGDLPQFNPLRLELQSYGFLAQLATNPVQQQVWLRKRIHLLQHIKIHDLRFGFDEPGRLSQIILSQQNLLVALEQELQHHPAGSSQADKLRHTFSQELHLSLEQLQAFTLAGGSWLGPELRLGLSNYLIWALEQPTTITSASNLLLQQLAAQAHEEWSLQPQTPPYNLAQQLKLQVLLAVYAQATGQQSQPATRTQLQQLQQSAALASLSSQRPDLHQEVKQLLAAYAHLTN